MKPSLHLDLQKISNEQLEHQKLATEQVNHTEEKPQSWTGDFAASGNGKDGGGNDA